MIDPLKAVARVVHGLLQCDENLIRFGRMDDRRDDFSAGYIALDSLSPATPVTRGEDFDGDAESMQYRQRLRMPVTLDFYGVDAWQTAQRFSVLLSSQKAYELQYQHGVTVGGATGITDVQALTGHQYGNQVQVALTIQFTAAVDVDTRRIDAAQFKFLED